VFPKNQGFSRPLLRNLSTSSLCFFQFNSKSGFRTCFVECQFPVSNLQNMFLVRLFRLVSWD
jgi:hypothetical protein